MRKKIVESLRLYEAKKKEALDSLAKDLRTRLAKVDGYSHHKLSIIPEYDEGRVEITFRGTGDTFYAYPQKSKISNESSNKVVSVDSIEGAYIEGNKVYNAEGELLGNALVRMKSIHNKSDYSTSLESAEFSFNSKITDLRRLEKYVASEAINNMK